MPVDWGARSPGEKYILVQDFRTQRASVLAHVLESMDQQVHDIVKARERGDTRLQKENFVRLQGPSSNFVEAIKEQRKQISKAREL